MEMATGQPLFPGDSDTEQLWLILQVGPAAAACCLLLPGCIPRHVHQCGRFLPSAQVTMCSH